MQKQCNVVISHNPFTPYKNMEFEKIDEGYSIQHWVDSHDELFQYPVVCMLDGQPMLRESWDGTIILTDSVIIFYKLPLSTGGGGFNPIQFIVGVALVVVGSYFFNPGLVQYGLITIGLSLAVLGSGLIGVPELPSADQGNQLAKASPTYSLSGQGNIARLGSSIPVIYGRHRVFPDFAAEPWSEFIDNNQFLYHLLVIGQGNFDVERIKIEDSNIEDFKEVSYRIIRPFEDVTSSVQVFRQLDSFPDPNVVNVLEISGQELILKEATNTSFFETAIGPFTINPAETKINKVQLDFVATRGLYDLDDEGEFIEVSLRIQYGLQLVDDLGANMGSEILTTIEMKGSDNEQIRQTFEKVIAPGRYKIRIGRKTTNRTESQVADTVILQSVKGFLADDPINFGNLTMLAVKMRATNNLSSRSSRKINCVVTRKIREWNPTDGWTEEKESNSLAWAVADALTNIRYGAKWADSRIDLQGFYDLDKILAARGDTFNGVFDRKISMWEGLKLIARAGRCAIILQGGVFRLIRDRPQTIPSAMFSQRNIVDNSLTIEYSMASEDTADGVDLEYIDSVTWIPKHIIINENGETPSNPAKVKLFGCTNAPQARREAIFLARNNIYRRKLMKFTTELEGHIPTFGDLVVISHDMPNWGISGDVVSVDVDTGVITLSEPIDLTDIATKRIAFRKNDGSVTASFNPVALIGQSEEDTHQVILDGLWQYVQLDGAVRLETASGELVFTFHYSNEFERTQFVSGPVDTWRQLGVVKAIKPRGEANVELQVISEDARVHEVPEEDS